MFSSTFQIVVDLLNRLSLRTASTDSTTSSKAEEQQAEAAVVPAESLSAPPATEVLEEPAQESPSDACPMKLTQPATLKEPEVQEPTDKVETHPSEVVPAADAQEPKPVPEDVPKQPEVTPNQPEEAPKQPEEAPEQPEETPKQPEEAPKQPEETPKQPEEAPKQHEETSKQPEETSKQPEETLKQSEEPQSSVQAEPSKEPEQQSAEEVCPLIAKDVTVPSTEESHESKTVENVEGSIPMVVPETLVAHSSPDEPSEAAQEKPEACPIQPTQPAVQEEVKQTESSIEAETDHTESILEPKPIVEEAREDSKEPQQAVQEEKKPTDDQTKESSTPAAQDAESVVPSSQDTTESKQFETVGELTAPTEAETPAANVGEPKESVQEKSDDVCPIQQTQPATKEESKATEPSDNVESSQSESAPAIETQEQSADETVKQPDEPQQSVEVEQQKEVEQQRDRESCPIVAKEAEPQLNQPQGEQQQVANGIEHSEN